MRIPWGGRRRKVRREPYQVPVDFLMDLDTYHFDYDPDVYEVDMHWTGDARANHEAEELPPLWELYR